jgi:hypothetical protein
VRSVVRIVTASRRKGLIIQLRRRKNKYLQNFGDKTNFEVMRIDIWLHGHLWALGLVEL